jgi:hypothetical protein
MRRTCWKIAKLRVGYVLVVGFLPEVERASSATSLIFGSENERVTGAPLAERTADRKGTHFAGAFGHLFWKWMRRGKSLVAQIKVDHCNAVIESKALLRQATAYQAFDFTMPSASSRITSSGGNN